MSTTSSVGVQQLFRYREFICGWGAACAETCIMFPAVKLIFRQQLHGVIFNEALHQLRTEGITRLYRGLLPPLIMRTSSRAVMYGMYDRYQLLFDCDRTLLQHKSIMSGCLACAALFAGVTEAIVLCPLERVQVLLQTAAYHDKFRNSIDALRVLRDYGTREYYRGFTPIVFRNAFSNVIFFALRDPLYIAFSADPSRREASLRTFASNFVSGAVLGASISTLFFPVNVVKHRMQSTVGTDFTSALRCFRTVWHERNRSMKELFRGVQFNYTRSLLAWGITNSIYELLLAQIFPHLPDR